ncbi:MAG: zf-HC2 domain-containing protein [Candidatus Binatia bacterium]
MKGDNLISAFSSSNRRTNRPRTHKRAARSRRASGSNKSRQPSITCKKEVDFIARYLAADLTGRELAAFEGHLELCRDCVAFLQTYKTTVELTRSFLSSQSRAGQPPELSLKPPRNQTQRR